MKNREIFNNRYSEKESQLEIINLIESSSNQTPTVEVPINSDTAFPGGLLLFTLSLLLLAWVLALLNRLNFKNSLSNRLNLIKHHHEIPCSSCQYFNQNFYLKCAVNPSKALSEEAINCPDYCSK